jgi:hypothetical protein
MQPASQNSNTSITLPVLVLALAISQIVTPALPALDIGQPIGSQSNAVRTLITPAGWAFSIWGPLYTGTIAFAIFQILPKQRGNALLKNLRWPAAGAFAGNAVWAAYTQVFGLSFISALIIIFTLTCLLVTYRIFSKWETGFTKTELWLAVLPLSALTAWLTAATIVNISASLRFHGVDAGTANAQVSALIVVIGGIIASTCVARGRGNPIYTLVFIWALTAIFAAGGQQSALVAWATGIAALLVIFGMVIGLRNGGAQRWFAPS